jgi:L,D-peptidoglycan transpeptidase YkuD (ErfK/YbiS/YcfS/YnhG family)
MGRMSNLSRRVSRRLTAGATAAVALLGVLAVSGGLLPGAGAATPITSATWQTCQVTLNGVPVTVDKTDRTRAVVNGTGGSWARLGFYVRTDSACGFRRVLLVDSRVGYNGITAGATRRQGTGTTPSGTYTMTEVFGNAGMPPTAMPYHRVQSGDWWVEDNTSLFYNELRNSSLGGYMLRTTGLNSSERLANFPTQYAHAIVINFNRAPDRKVLGRGAGIFLHVNGSGATAGCVSITHAALDTLLSYLRPGDSITIAA